MGERFEILVLGAAAAGFTTLMLYHVSPDRFWWPALCFDAMYAVMAIRLFRNCRCGKERHKSDRTD